MTGAELFELLKKTKTYYEYYALQKGDYPQGGWITFNLNDLVAFIDNYFLTRPLYDDGTPVKVGDEFAPHKPSDSKKIIDYWVCDDGSFAINYFQYDQDQRVKKPEKKPDSWEKLESDFVENSDTDYCKSVINKDVAKTTFEEDRRAVLQDVIRRVKELAKGDSE